MKKKISIIFLALLLTGILLYAQNKLAWSDFGVITSKIEQCESLAAQPHKEIEGLKTEKEKIMDNTDRFNALKLIIDIHPDYTMPDLAARYNKLKNLMDYIEAQGLN